MTDKQIIIDGVDVSGCAYITYRYSGKPICNESGMYCGGYDICYYKQLKRKEQEYEELKKELQKNFKEKDTLHLIIDRLLEASGYDTNTASAEDFEDVYEHMRYEQQQLDQLKAENEQLKEKYKELGQCAKQLKDYFEQEKESLSNRFLKLKQTLTEIKEIAEAESYLSPQSTRLLVHKILQKISEVEDEYNG